MLKWALTQGEYAIVDDDIYLELDLLGKSWCVSKRGHTSYAITDAGGRKQKRRVYLHRWITGASKGQHVDHINGDGLDNRRCNLRLVTRSQNLLNQNSPTRSVSGYRGVRRVKNGNGWSAYFNYCGKQTSLGSYETVEFAACARDYHVIDLGLESYAPLNFHIPRHTRDAVEAARTYIASGHPDIRFKSGKWEVGVRVNGQRRYVGRFASLQVALVNQRLASSEQSQ